LVPRDPRNEQAKHRHLLFGLKKKIQPTTRSVEGVVEEVVRQSSASRRRLKMADLRRSPPFAAAARGAWVAVGSSKCSGIIMEWIFVTKTKTTIMIVRLPERVVVVGEVVTLSGVERERGRRVRSAADHSTPTLLMRRRRATVVIVVAPRPSTRSCTLSVSRSVRTI
jgi:hypothetical protein